VLLLLQSCKPAVTMLIHAQDAAAFSRFICTGKNHRVVGGGEQEVLVRVAARGLQTRSERMSSQPQTRYCAVSAQPCERHSAAAVRGRGV